MRPLLVAVVVPVLIATHAAPSASQTAVAVSDATAESNLSLIRTVTDILQLVQIATRDSSNNILSSLGGAGLMNPNSPFGSVLGPIQSASIGSLLLNPPPAPLYAAGDSSLSGQFYNASISRFMPTVPASIGQQETYASAVFYAPAGTQLDVSSIAARSQIRRDATRQAAVDALATASATAASEGQVTQISSGLTGAMSSSENVRQDMALNTQSILLMCQIALREEKLEALRLKLEASRVMSSDPSLVAGQAPAGQ